MSALPTQAEHAAVAAAAAVSVARSGEAVIAQAYVPYYHPRALAQNGFARASDDRSAGFESFYGQRTFLDDEPRPAAAYRFEDVQGF